MTSLDTKLINNVQVPPVAMSNQAMVKPDVDKPESDKSKNSKHLGFALAGLATLGIAGIGIYKLCKSGKSSGALKEGVSGVSVGKGKNIDNLASMSKAELEELYETEGGKELYTKLVSLRLERAGMPTCIYPEAMCNLENKFVENIDLVNVINKLNLALENCYCLPAQGLPVRSVLKNVGYAMQNLLIYKINPSSKNLEDISSVYKNHVSMDDIEKLFTSLKGKSVQEIQEIVDTGKILDIDNPLINRVRSLLDSKNDSISYFSADNKSMIGGEKLNAMFFKKWLGEGENGFYKIENFGENGFDEKNLRKKFNEHLIQDVDSKRSLFDYFVVLGNDVRFLKFESPYKYTKSESLKNLAEYEKSLGLKPEDLTEEAVKSKLERLSDIQQCIKQLSNNS